MSKYDICFIYHIFIVRCFKIENFELVTNYGALVVFFVVVIKYMKNKFENEDVINNNQQNEMLNFMLKQFQQNNESLHNNYREDISELKKIILNESNMNEHDFEFLVRIIIENITFRLRTEMISIIDHNHITASSQSIANKKINNLVDTVVNSFIYKLKSVNYDCKLIDETCIVLNEEKSDIKKYFVEIIQHYVEQNNDFKREDAIKRIEESIKYITNSLESNFCPID